MTSQFEREIREQPEVIARLLSDGREDVNRIAERIRSADPRFVMIAARGTSDNAARYAQYLLGARNHLPVALATPSLFTLYHAPPRLSQGLVIGISQSGQSPDIVAVIAEARLQGVLTLAITNDPASALAEAADLRLELRVGAEQAVAASKTYTAELTALAMLSTALAGNGEGWSQLEKLPQSIDETLCLNGHLDPTATRFVETEQFIVVGRGFNYATAYEVALKIKETSYVVAEAHSSAEFRHGPIAVVDEGFPVILIAPSGAALQDVLALYTELKERNAEVLLISDRHELLKDDSRSLPIPSGVPEWLSPIVAVVPGQLWALALARAKGIDPDQPRGLSKVTRTR